MYAWGGGQSSEFPIYPTTLERTINVAHPLNCLVLDLYNIIIIIRKKSLYGLQHSSGLVADVTINDALRVLG